MVYPTPPLALVPAAGRSRRFGEPKLLMPWPSASCILAATVAALRAGGAREVWVVVRVDDEDLRTAAEAAGASVAFNPDSERGMLSSIHCGLAAMAQATLRGRWLLVSPGDLPTLRPETVARLTIEACTGSALLLVPRYEGRRGHPVAVAPALIPEIAELDNAVGLRQLLERHSDALRYVDVEDRGVLCDVDTRDDYLRLRQEARRSRPTS